MGVWPTPYTAIDDVNTKQRTSCSTDSLTRFTLPTRLFS